MTRLARLALIPALALAVACGDKDDDSGTTDGTDGTTDGADGTADGTDGTGVDGATVYASTCQNCHGANGNDGFGDDLTVEVPARSDEELSDVIQNGSGNMAAQNLSDAELDAVLVYLRATFG